MAPLRNLPLEPPAMMFEPKSFRKPSHAFYKPRRPDFTTIGVFMKTLRLMTIAGFVLVAGCASIATDTYLDPPPSAAEKTFSYQSCIQSQRVVVCGGPLDGKTCLCVDGNRLWGQPHLPLGGGE